MTKFIQKAVKHPGSLRRWAEQHHFINSKGTIDLSKAEKYAKKEGLKHRLKEINLAKTLRRVRKRK